MSARIGGALGVLSLLLLAASIAWAHHWGAQADTLVACWGGAVVGALWFSGRSARASHHALERTPRLAKLGFWLAGVSLAALVVAGIAAAAGLDPAGACGGG
jgi:hypothetical protein